MKQFNNLTILAIETSCDDTCIAIVKAERRGTKCRLTRMNFKILSNIISSQIKIHREYGGVYPTLAKREHQHNLVPVLKQALKKSSLLESKIKNQKLKIKSRSDFPGSPSLHSAQQNLEKILEREKYLFKKLKSFFKKYKKPEIDLIAVTVGPGLDPCLWVGINFAKALAFFWKLPIIPINHIEAHIFANWLTSISSKSKNKKDPTGRSQGLQQKSKKQIKRIKLPAVCLIVSGGHTQLILMKNYREYKILGETRDDAAGECFDKVARILGLRYPGGPEIEWQAVQLKSKIKNQKLKIRLPRSMIHQKNFDFSFSGLKTAVLYNFKKQLPKVRTSKNYIQEMSAEVQQAIIDVLISKTIKAAREYKAKTIILGGGVTANDELRKQFQLVINNQQLTIKFLVPPKIFCTDNAAMGAVAGYSRYLRKETGTWRNIKADANLRIG